jgi:hypothetical protein
MSYTFNYTNAALNNKAPFSVAVGTLDTTTTDLTFTGKGAANFGQAQQTNLLRLLENFANTTEPTHATIGQLWYDSSERTLKVCTQSTPTKVWQELNGVQVTDIGEPAPGTVSLPPLLGDMWLQRTGTGSGYLYVFTGLGRYPTTATTIGGWEQIWPAVEVYAGRDEYDSMRQLLDMLCGVGVSTYGSGAIGHSTSASNLTDFAALDLDLRTKYKALGVDANVLYSPNSELGISEQDISKTLFYFNDANTSGDGYLSGPDVGGYPSLTSAGSFLLDGVVTAVAAQTPIWHSQQVDGGYIMYDGTNALVATNVGALTADYFVVQQLPTGQWQYDNNTTWVNFTPAANQLIIGTITSGLDNNSLSPVDIVAIVWAHAVPLVVARPKYEHLKVEPNSQDWDALLSVVKYALSRLDLPAGFTRTVSQLPFVCDGRQVPASLQGLATTDVRYPSPARRAGRRGSSVGLGQSFAETINALNVAIDNRFSLRGINGASGTNTTLLSTASIDTGLTATGAPTVVGVTTDATFRLSFASDDQLMRWLGAGSAIRFAFTHTGGASPGDTNLRTLFSSGLYVITADRVRVFDSTASLHATQATVGMGLWNATAGGQQLATYTNGATLTVFAAVSRTIGSVYFDITFVLTPNGAVAGSLSTVITLVQDHENSGAVYPILTNANLTATNSF